MAVFDNQTGRLSPQAFLHQRYTIIGLAGRGGMGAVYQAIDTRSTNPPNRQVAIKEMSQNHLSEDELLKAANNFQQEAAMLGALSHPNLPRIYDAFSERGRYYLVMDYIAGKTLLQLLKESGGRPIPVIHMLNYAIQLCAVLNYLHQRQPAIIFRDLKPANVMVTEQGHAFLIDFGIARIFKEGQTQDTLFLGSPGYASPEQHGTAQTNPRSDLYSLGATIHCCLTGRDPYHSEDRFAFIPMRQVNPQVPIELDQLVQRLLHIDDQQRPASAVEVRQVLIRIAQQATESTSALPPPAVDHSASTQYMPPGASNAPQAVPTVEAMPRAPQAASTQPANTPSTPQQPPTVAVAPRMPSTPGTPPLPQRSNNGITLWNRKFVVLFALSLIVTVGGSIFAVGVFLFSQPNHVPYGLSFLVAFVLALLLCLGSIVASNKVHTPAPRAILVFTGIAALVSSLVCLTLALRDIQLALESLLSLSAFDLSHSLDIILTGGLLACALLSLLWLLRPFAPGQRITLLIIFGIAAACVLIQAVSGLSDETMPKHLFLLVALIALMQGSLLAVQTERTHEQGAAI